jgi:hypothetical protein
MAANTVSTSKPFTLIVLSLGGNVSLEYHMHAMLVYMRTILRQAAT